MKFMHVADEHRYSQLKKQLEQAQQKILWIEKEMQLVLKRAKWTTEASLRKEG